MAGGDGVTFVGTAGAATARCRSTAVRRGWRSSAGIDDGSQIYVTSADASGDPQVSIIDVIGTAAKDGPVVTGRRCRCPAP